MDAFASLVPPELLPLSGGAFYSGPEAFSRPSPIYLLGLNPGGDPQVHPTHTVERHLGLTSSGPANWSAYRDESWSSNGGPPGEHGLQPRVLHLLGRLGLDPGAVPSSNLVFARSAREATMASGQMRTYADACWPVHAKVIDSLEVQVVVCFGQTVGGYVRDRLDAHQEIDHFTERNKRRWTSRVHLGRGGVRVATVTHPSIADWRTPATDVSDLVARALAGSEPVVHPTD